MSRDFAVNHRWRRRNGTSAWRSITVRMPLSFILAGPADIKRAIDTTYKALSGVDRLVRAFNVT